MVTFTPPLSMRYLELMAMPSETQSTFGFRGAGGKTSMLFGWPSLRSSNHSATSTRPGAVPFGRRTFIWQPPVSVRAER
jgi:hypothetical protein